MYVGLMTNWTKNLFNPIVVEREPSTTKQIPPLAVVAGTALFAEVFGGDSSTIDKAAFIAYPLAIKEAAKYGAYIGNGASKN